MGRRGNGLYDVEEAFQNGYVLLFNSLKVKLCSSEIITSPCIIMDMGWFSMKMLLLFWIPTLHGGTMDAWRRIVFFHSTVYHMLVLVESCIKMICTKISY